MHAMRRLNRNSAKTNLISPSANQAILGSVPTKLLPFVKCTELNSIYIFSVSICLKWHEIVFVLWIVVCLMNNTQNEEMF